MFPVKIRAEDETGKIQLNTECKGPGPMTIEGPCVVDAIIDASHRYTIVGVRFDSGEDNINGDPKYNIGDIIKWNDTAFLIRKIENNTYKTLSLASGSSFAISCGYADKNSGITLEA